MNFTKDELKADIETVIQENMFEYNTEETRRNITDAVDDFFLNRNIPFNEYSIVCDETNNTKDTIANNELHLSVHYMENDTWFQINAQVRRSGVEFESI